MKTKFTAFLICFLMIGGLLYGFPCAASEAGNNPIAVNMDLSKTEFSEPEDVTVSIRVSNVGDDRIPGPVYLFYPDGKAVTDFGDGGAASLGLGDFEAWTGTWHVTQKQLEAGRITFMVKYPVPDDQGNVNYKSKYYNKAITFSGAAPGLEVTRVITPPLAPKDQKITITYELKNTGNVSLNTIRITENKSISSSAATIDVLEINASEQVMFEVTMQSKDLTSSAIITYKASGSSQTEKITVDAETIEFEEPPLPYTFDISEGKATIIKYTGTETAVVVPAELDGYPVAAIGDKAFENCDTVTGITFPEGVTYIGDYTLRNCSKLAYVCLPKSVTSIGVGAFYGCGSLMRIEMDTQNAVYSVTGGVLFDNLKKMLHTYPAGKQDSEYSVPEGTAAIAKTAFYSCSSLQDIYLPESVTEIGFAAFSGCSSLTDINLPAGLTGIGINMFRGCTKLRAILIPENVTAIGDGAFGSCMSLNRVMIPDSVKQIGNSAFLDNNGWPKPWLILYGAPGSYAQAYARENGIAFADTQVYRSLYGLDAFAKSSGSVPRQSADDPFAIFDSVPGAAPNTPQTGEFNYFTDLVLDSLWPTTGPARAKGDAELSPVQSYREQVLESGGELSTTVSVQPGEGLEGDITSLLRSLQLKFHEKRQEDTAACALELVAGGTVPMYFSGMADKDAAYLSGSLLEGDVLTVSREEIRAGLLNSIQSLLSFLDTASSPQAWYLASFFRSFMQEGSGFTETLSGGGGQTDAFLSRLMDRFTKAEDTVQSELYDSVSESSILHFTGDDVKDLLLLPQPNFWMRVLSLRLDFVPGYTSLVEILQQGNMYFNRSLYQLFQIIEGGEITIRRGVTGEVVAVEGFIDFDLGALPDSDMKSARFNFTFFKKTGPEGALYTMSGKLNVVYNEESATRFGAEDYDAMYLDGVWQDSGNASAQGTLRIRTQEPGRPSYVLDTGLQYKRVVSGTKENGSEEQRFNFYYKNGEDMETACLVSSYMVDKDGIGQNISLYLNDLQKPVMTVSLDTQAVQNSGLMDDVITPDSSRLINPIYWSFETIQMYIASHKDAIDKAVSMLSCMLPPDVKRFFDGL